MIDNIIILQFTQCNYTDNACTTLYKCFGNRVANKLSIQFLHVILVNEHLKTK